MAFSEDFDENSNMLICDKILLSHGPIVVYTTRNDVPTTGLENKFEIMHGWSPLLFSTAKCFTRLMCYGEEPVYSPIIWKLVVNSGEVKINTKSQPEVTKEDETTCTVDNIEVQDNGPEMAVANIFMADMSDFSETVEMHTTGNLTIYAEKVDRIVMRTGTKIIFNRFSY